MGEAERGLPGVDPELLVSVARSRPRQPVTAATPGQVDLVVELGALSRAIVEHNRRVMACERVDWSVLADALFRAAEQCWRQVVVDPGSGDGD